LASGTGLSKLGSAFRGIPERLAYTAPHTEGSALVGEVVFVDRFGSLITNLAAELIPATARVEVEDLDVGPLRRTFSDVTNGGLLAYIGSGGAVEIAVRNGSAARRLGIGVGGRVRARLNAG
jgi:S-adenosylmethionine hydrolase